jgi:hypothetical protein
MTNENKLDLNAIRKRAEVATEGPWQCANTTDGPWILDDGDMIITGTCERDADGEFIAHARQDVPALIAEVERLKEAIELAKFFWKNKGARY